MAAKIGNSWQVQEAKAHLTDLIRKANDDGPQSITRFGEPVAVVVSEKQYRRLAAHKPPEPLVEFFRARFGDELADFELPERDPSNTGRDVDFP